jgi:hypothetical protein
VVLLGQGEKGILGKSWDSMGEVLLYTEFEPTLEPLFDIDQSCFCTLDKPSMPNPYVILPQLPLADAASSLIPSSSRSNPYGIES